MLTQQLTHLEAIVQNDSGINPAYRHTAKFVTPGAPLEVPGAFFKWYAVHPTDRTVPDEIDRLARAYLTAQPLEARGLGFVVLHRCGQGFYFLIVCTWRNENEIWQTVFYKNGDGMPDFALWPRDAEHKPTLCVWELVPVWHEQQAWVRYLESERDLVAAQRWLADRFTGKA